MSELSQRIANLSPEKRKLLLQKLNEKKGNPFSPIAIAPQSRESNSFPLSFAQKRLWLLYQLNPDNAAYNIAQAMRLKGQLNVSTWERSINEIVRRHEALRTTFVTVDGQSLQVIAPTLTLTIPVVDIQELPPTMRERKVQQLATEEAQRPFDLTKGPLLRVMLLQLGKTEYVMLFVIHHIVCDGWSLSILIQELSALYKDFNSDRPVLLPELPIQYVDFALWQRQWFQQEGRETQLAYWKQQLASAPSVTELPTDHPRPVIQTYQGATQFLQLSKSLTEALKALSQQERVTLFMTLLAAFKTLLHRYAEHEDILVGTTVSGRNRVETEGLIGFFVNTLVIRTYFGGNPSFRELLARVRQVASEAYAHQDLPFEQILEELKLERHLSHTPLFQVMFQLQNFLRTTLELPGLSVSPLEFEKETARFDLAMEMVETEQGLIGTMEYNVALFDEVTITQMLSCFQTLLEGIVANPDQRLSNLPLLTPAQQQVLLVDWNDTSVEYSQQQSIHQLVEYPQQQSIHQLFEAQVERTPDAVAVIFEDEQLTYWELNTRANQLAHYLQKLGVKPEVLVGICVERSLSMVIGLLAILKAGGAYIPLDPNYPQKRLSFILQDTQVSVLLTHQHLIEKLPEHKAQVVCLDNDFDIITQQKQDNPISSSEADNLAYVIYTSGSTGEPKGVFGLHKGAINRFEWMWQNYPFVEQEICCQKTSLNFVDSVWEIFGPLLQGVTTVIVPDIVVKDPQQFITTLSHNHVTRVVLVPSLLRVLLSTCEILQLQLPKLKLWISSGEALSTDLPVQFRQSLPDSTLLNLYGSSEVSADVTCYSISPQAALSTSVLIGHPIANTQIYILDDNQRPVPVGVPGEIYVSGDQLARGYLNRPELTAEKFIPNPFSDKPSARLYKTGDKARYLPSGEIEYIGRIDHQVKLRGFRIELGEIETLISQYPGVQESVVTVHCSQADSQQIVAYVIPQKEQTLAISEVRCFLESKLPNYMVPSAFVTLEALPLTPNGKVDRKALPIPDLTQVSSSQMLAPSTPIENLLTGVWAEILGIDKVGINNNFFELGGHSLIATRVISQIRQVFQIELPLRYLFEKPTIAGLAKEIEKAIKVDSGIESTKIEWIKRSPELPLSFAQQRLWFLAQLEPDSPFYNIPAAVRLQGKLNVEALQQSFNEIISRHETLRTNFQTTQGQAIAVISEKKPLTLSIFDISELPSDQQEAEIKQQATQEAQQPFDLKSDLLLRVKLLRLNDQEHIVLLTMHHIVSDGWSIGVLVQELATLYQAFCNEQPSPLTELPIQYVDFAVWQRQWLQTEVLETQISYWRKHLENAPEVLELPTDHPRPAIQKFRGATYSFELSKQLSVALNKLSQEQGSTLFMTLLAGFQTLLWSYTGQEDIVVGSPIANRNRAEIEGLIGFFVNTLVLRTNLAGNPSFQELLKRVREVALGAYAHQDLPFELLVEQLQPQRNLSHTPLFQVMFVLQNAPMSALELPGLTLTSLQSNSDSAKFDLTLNMSEIDSKLVGSIEYNTDLFEQSTISRMVGHLQTLLSGIVANPQQRLSELALLSNSEQHQLLLEWNNTEVEYPQEHCIHQLFEAQVERTPDAVAVVFESEQLTYCELNTKANQLAHYLRSLGVKPEVLVGICVERSLSMVIGLLAILKAGGAYVPLDPSYPKERLAYMLADSQPGVLLTQQYLVESLPNHKAQVICINSNWELIANENPRNPACKITVDHLAYVIYTSGSTGKPKGAMNTHRGICNRLLWMQDTYQLTTADSVLQKTPFSFDVSVWEFFWPLMTGARLVVAQPEGHREPNYLVNLILQQQITTLHFVPSMLQVFVETEGLEKCQSLVRVIVSGEALPVQLQQRFFNRLDAQLHNLYGPTEAAVDVTFWQCQDRVNNQKTVPIGHPIANIQIYLLDKYLNPVAFGVPGELYIGGVGIGRGYLNRPDLTAEKFIPNPFSDKPSARLYKTGDLARYLTSGEIEYIGRIDHQVKLRGFRIELGEIEALISQHPVVRETVVTAHTQSLVAYVVPQHEQTLAITELRHFLESKLPNYMVPAAFVTLETLPLTPNGKVDRKALPAPDTARPQLEAIYQPPQTDVEKTIANIWQEVLNVENVGIHDNFFELGGHSLLLVQVHSKLREVFQSDLSILDLFRYPTISSLVDYFNQVKNGKLFSGVVDVVTEKIADGKAQQRKRLQKMKSLENI
ncbi:non-ribosomal peptide synthetase [Nostoc sp. LPT]|uniref:non-ribosomal peptide synthetase n=1 Tax=Nostoc sp. LPT TaxID=2815387 RepID=UPI001DB93E30|nr:non-ribosomal peptide synthetase [Nostoc sp. LPT]MBN4003641.1 amino acid adenylation domain-containing protein [Nostoc sp. LPT]